MELLLFCFPMAPRLQEAQNYWGVCPPADVSRCSWSDASCITDTVHQPDGATPVHPLDLKIYILMADGQGRSKRNIKTKKDKDFIYEEDFECFLPKKNSSKAIDRQPSSDSDCPVSSNASVSSIPCFKENWQVQTAPVFTFIDDLPLSDCVIMLYWIILVDVQ